MSPNNSGASSTIVLCIFCSERRPKSEEDVLPLWLSRELNSTGQVITEFITEIPGQPRTSRFQPFGNLATLKLERICHICNNEWMSKLEDMTSPLLIPMIQGQACQLTTEDQRQISAWAQLKCLTLDAFYPQTHGGVRHLPERMAHAFCQTYQPLLSSTVTIGQFIPSAANEKIRWGRYMSSLPPTDVYASLDVVVCTLALGQLLMQVSIAASGFEQPREALHHLVRRHPMFDCWPADRVITWPPTDAVVGDQFDDVAKALIYVNKVTDVPGPSHP